jgi:hypothetical protein
VADLKTCGNGLAFLDTDPTFTLEQCEELHLVECGPRTELEPPVATRNCPRLYGTFPDPESCSVFWKCFDGKANRYECPPGLAYDAVSRGCKWADQVPECKNVVVAVEGKEEEFKCPSRGAVGTFTKHAHPSDCRQYFVCIGGVPREYGCPLGTVFSIGSDEFSGKCVDPEEVPECANYYGDLQFDSVALSRAGADTGPQAERVRSGGDHAFRNTLNTVASDEPVKRPSAEEGKRRPAPPSLQAIIDETAGPSATVQQAEPARVSRPRPVRPPVRPASEEPAPVAATEAPATTRARPSTDAPIRIQTERTTDLTDLPTEAPSRIQILTDRPKTTLSRRPPAVASTFPVTATSRPFTAVFSPEQPESTFSPTAAPSELPTVTAAPSTIGQVASTVQPVTAVTGGDGLPDPAPASPGPNGEEYYYYYYYYDDEEGSDQKPVKQKQPRPAAPSA